MKRRSSSSEASEIMWKMRGVHFCGRRRAVRASAMTSALDVLRSVTGK